MAKMKPAPKGIDEWANASRKIGKNSNFAWPNFGVVFLGTENYRTWSKVKNTSSYINTMTGVISTALNNLQAANYADNVDSFAAAVQRRGRLFHSEMNLPVYQALQALATVVQSYGRYLTSNNLIDRGSTIRTFTVGSSIVEAQAAWANNVNYPGKERMRKLMVRRKPL
ncbi:hypothetical protein M8818_004722 [Zalaria obscura]|uniref:Uncharacterized protein n=1 Tax=Zalaria obscura TaxID=2024903 RepID=A0ACC3SBY4_9PEZI